MLQGATRAPQGVAPSPNPHPVGPAVPNPPVGGGDGAGPPPPRVLWGACAAASVQEAGAVAAAAAAVEGGKSGGAPALVGGSMAEQEGPEFGKADFVLLDEVTMEHFMENLRLRYGVGDFFGGWRRMWATPRDADPVRAVTGAPPAPGDPKSFVVWGKQP